MRPFAGPPLPRLVRRDALRRAAACERPHAAQRKNVRRTCAGRTCVMTHDSGHPVFTAIRQRPKQGGSRSNRPDKSLTREGSHSSDRRRSASITVGRLEHRSWLPTAAPARIGI